MKGGNTCPKLFTVKIHEPGNVTHSMVTIGEKFHIPESGGPCSQKPDSQTCTSNSNIQASLNGFTSEPKFNDAQGGVFVRKEIESHSLFISLIYSQRCPKVLPVLKPKPSVLIGKLAVCAAFFID